MRRLLGFAAFLSASVPALLQPTGVLHITVAVADTGQKATPVPRHALLISDDPATAEPRQVITRLDGTVDVTLRAGRYVVESDRPVVFQGKAYRWTQAIEIAAGRETALALTPDNAEVESGGAPAEDDTAFLLPQWNEGVVGVWTPTTHASAFAIDANGLLVTNQRVVGAATTVEVQVSPSVKVAANVLAADAAKDVAVLWVDASAAASVRPLPLSCGQASALSIAAGQPIVAIGVSLWQQKDITSTKAGRVDADGIALDATLANGSLGGPVFTPRGEFVGLTSMAPPEEGRTRGETRVVRAREICSVVAASEPKTKQAAKPSAARLPVEPVKPFPRKAFEAAAVRRAGSLNPYVVEGSTFEAAFITPMATFGTQYQDELSRTRARGASKGVPDNSRLVRPLLEFSNWSDYVWDFPPVLLVRVTPRLVEGFWTTVARGAAMTQGVALPPIKRFKSGFSRLQAFCGDTEVTPIHPFKLERRVSETDAIYEGLYVYDPEALGPQCPSVKLVMYSEKEPDKGDTRVVDPAIVKQVWQDFAPYR